MLWLMIAEEKFNDAARGDLSMPKRVELELLAFNQLDEIRAAGEERGHHPLVVRGSPRGPRRVLEIAEVPDRSVCSGASTAVALADGVLCGSCRVAAPTL